ncbi:hypothetical protein niasHT_004061 [Heterodera trifolii]|uniref:Uncharacterized protein n=1 Tax=Heterodera trifolii TaxID=157864 RepID=A0ABD2M7C8_9BILA
MSNNRNGREEKMAKAIFISGDGWLAVFDLLTPSQLGLGIALISHRFDFYVDEHFKTRKWTLAFIEIRSKNGENGTNQMEIVNCDHGKPVPIPQIQLPRKVIGFNIILITFIDRNSIAFLHCFRPLFASFCPINLIIRTNNQRISEFIWRNIWPMLGKNIHSMGLFANILPHLRQYIPALLNDCPSLRVVTYFDEFLPEFPADDSAMASDRQAMAKWLFTPLQNNVPKIFECRLFKDVGNLASKVETFKAAFASASSPSNFIVVIRFPPSFAHSIVPFDQNNELTREQLALKRTENSDHFLLIRRPIARDESKWTVWEKEAIGWQLYDQWNTIDIQIFNEHAIGDGLLDATPGPSDLQQK